MTEYPYILFNKSPEQLRQLGACGGRASARNQRARRALVATPPEVVPPPALHDWELIGDILAHERGGLKLCPRSLLCFLGPPVALLTSCRLPLRGWLSANRNFS